MENINITIIICLVTYSMVLTKCVTIGRKQDINDLCKGYYMEDIKNVKNKKDKHEEHNVYEPIEVIDYLVAPSGTKYDFNGQRIWD